MFARTDSNRAWDVMQSEWKTIRNSSPVDGDNIEYHAQQLINAYVAGLCNQGVQGSYRSCYYRISSNINEVPVTIRVANHRGYCDASYKRAHGNTGVALFDLAINDEPTRYIISIEVLKDRDKRPTMRVVTDVEDNITHIELININSASLLDECISYIDNEVNDLF
jgi:hypothetical protein